MRQSDKISYKGVANARRGYCEYAKTLYEDVVKFILNNVSAWQLRLSQKAALTSCWRAKSGWTSS